jgi:hypothetical protein
VAAIKKEQKETGKERRFADEVLLRMVGSLKLGKAPGIDGIVAEHVIHASGQCPHLITLIADIFQICSSAGIVPTSFCKGILIPVLKKPHLDPSLAKNYRPITVATTFSKLLEKLILTLSPHQFHGLQFGFVEERGTDMAVALTHDVITLCRYEESPVYSCSLDAEGAFDALPHSILLRKAEDIIPDDLWCALHNWYSRLTVQVKWYGFIGDPMPVVRGTRQGGLSSPFLFNLFYQDLVEQLNNKQCGVRLFNRNYNVFCYADDLLLISLTSSWLQRLIDVANKYVVENGLRFNATKTMCTVHGPRDHTPANDWMLNGATLSVESHLQYLGVTLDGKRHSDERISACRRAFFSLESAGLHPRGLDPATMAHLWNAAVRPVLAYGAHCVHIPSSSVDALDRMQASLVKRALGLPKSSHNTDLLKALNVQTVRSSRQTQCAKLLRRTLSSDSQTCDFYSGLIAMFLLDNINRIPPKCNVFNVLSHLHEQDFSFIRFILSDCAMPRESDATPKGV